LRNFCHQKAVFLFFGLCLDLDFEFLKLLGLWLDLDGVIKFQDWIWIAKYDSPLISDVEKHAGNGAAAVIRDFSSGCKTDWFKPVILSIRLGKPGTT